MGKGKKIADASVARFSTLENRLSGTLKPVTPRKEFINRLGQHIQTGLRPTFVNRVANWHIFALLAAGLVSLAVFLAMLARVLIELAGKRRTA
jgi:hypothetical protein